MTEKTQKAPTAANDEMEEWMELNVMEAKLPTDGRHTADSGSLKHWGPKMHLQSPLQVIFEI